MTPGGVGVSQTQLVHPDERTHGGARTVGACSPCEELLKTLQPAPLLPSGRSDHALDCLGVDRVGSDSGNVLRERVQSIAIARAEAVDPYQGARSAGGPRNRSRAERRHESWIRAELALVLLESTGRRRGAIMGLRWSDIDFAAGQITWRAEHDNKRKTWVVPYPTSLFNTVREFQRRLGAVGGRLFPRADDLERPAPAEPLSPWIRKAEEHASLPKLEAGTCHPYRRK